MSDRDKRDPKPSDKTESDHPHRGGSGAGRSGTAGSIGAELGDLDFEPDALLDSLLSEDDSVPGSPTPSTPAPPAPPAPSAAAKPPAPPRPASPSAPRAPAQPHVSQPGPKLHEPEQREFPADEVTMVGDRRSLGGAQALAGKTADTGDDIDSLLAEPTESVPPGPAAPAAPPRPPAARPAAAPRPPPPRPAPPAPRPPPPAPSAPTAAAENSADSRSAKPAAVDDFDGLEMLNAGSFAELPPSAREPVTTDETLDDDIALENAALATGSLQSLPPEAVDDFEELTPSHTPDESQLAARAASITPPPSVRSGRPAGGPTAWSDEQPAAAQLAAHEMRDDWLARAELLESEAQSASDPQVRARSLLISSELWAMAGEPSRAREAASAAAKAAPSMPLAHRQVRWLAASEDDWAVVATALESETRASPTPEARAHAALLSAELNRLILGETESAKRKFEQAARALPSDPRAHTMKLAEQLGQSADPPRIRWPEAPALATLVDATHELVRLRGGAAPDEAKVDRSKTSFGDARAAIQAQDLAAAGDAVAELARIDGLERGALWLASSLFASASASRPRSIQLLQRLLEQGPDPLVSRALAARALEQGAPDALQAAIRQPGDAGDEAAPTDPFTAADRAALGALTDGGAEGVRQSLEELAADESLRPLAAACEASSLPPGQLPTISSGEERSRSEVQLGRAVAAAVAKEHAPDLLRTASESFAITHPDHPLSRVLALELALSAHDAANVAEALAAWPGDDEDGEAVRDRHLAAGLAYEAGGNSEAAMRQYASAAAADATYEAAARVLASRAAPHGAAELLLALARACGDDAQRALLLIEAAVRRGDENPEGYQALLAEAAEAMPSLPFAYRLGEQHARANGDVERLVQWLQRRRDASTDEVERAMDEVREAQLVADSDLELAASLLEQASQARPGDVALRSLHDRLTPGARASKGEWREQLAGSLEPDQALPLLLEAALEFKRAGDAEGAARAAVAAVQRGSNELAEIAAERNAGAGPGSAALSEDLLSRARAAEDPTVERELYERCSKLDRARGDQSSALLWQTAILEHEPQYLPALRRLEQAYIEAGREDELGPVAATLAPLLDANEATAHAILAARIRARSGQWLETRDLVDIAVGSESPSLWALRQLSALARATGDDEAVLKADRWLCDLSTRGIDAATLALRAAEAAARLGNLPEASALLERAVELVPEHLVALTTRAEVLDSTGDATGAAESFEALAAASAVPAHQLGAWHQAALLWLDKVGDTDRGLLALEHAAEIDVNNEDVFERLQALYVAANERGKLASLIEQRLEQTTDPEQRIALEVTRGRALAEVGDRAAAKQALAAALDANPDHAEALDAFAEICMAEGDWSGAEQAWIRLARHAAEPERQANIYEKLGELYEGELENPERAELSYQEVLKRRPDDVAATERLVDVYGRLGNTAKAVELANGLVERAENPDEKCERTIALARVYDEVVGDPKKAEATLERARKQWSHNGDVLRALSGFYQRKGEERALHMVLDRAATDARRALGTGRFDTSFFEILGTVAELKGDADSAKVAVSTIAALEGREDPLRGGGPAAGDARLDEFLSPELLSLPLRALLKKSGDALDAAYPVDLRVLRAAPMPAESQDFVGNIQQLARAFGINSLDVFVSTTIGAACMPVSSNPPQLVFGKALLDGDDDAARYFLLVRALKILQAHASTLSRTSPIDLWPLTAAYLSVFAPDWQPQGVDAKKMAEARQRIQGAMPRNLDPDVPVLALEVVGSIGNRAAQLATAVNQWGNRTGLLALGNPTAALRAIALSLGQQGGMPAEGPDRIKWIVRHPEARGIAVFSVSEQYSEARRRLNLVG